MIGDAPGDLAAADANSVFFYPILVNHEIESWSEFCSVFELFTSGNYSDYEQQIKETFLKNLQH